jgi:hypothetical protein
MRRISFVLIWVFIYIQLFFFSYISIAIEDNVNQNDVEEKNLEKSERVNQLFWSTINSGSAIESTNGSVQISATIGQSVIGMTDNSNYCLYSGFWNPSDVIKSDVEENNRTFQPATYELDQNYPNPFNPTTIINYALPCRSRLTLKIYNMLGKRVKILVNEIQTKGYKSVHWDGLDDKGQQVPSGFYFYELIAVPLEGVSKSEANIFKQSRKMLLLK